MGMDVAVWEEEHEEYRALRAGGSTGRDVCTARCGAVAKETPRIMVARCYGKLNAGQTRLAKTLLNFPVSNPQILTTSVLMRRQIQAGNRGYWI